MDPPPTVPVPIQQSPELPWSLEAQHLTTPCNQYPCLTCFCPAPPQQLQGQGQGPIIIQAPPQPPPPHPDNYILFPVLQTNQFPGFPGPFSQLIGNPGEVQMQPDGFMRWGGPPGSGGPQQFIPQMMGSSSSNAPSTSWTPLPSPPGYWSQGPPPPPQGWSMSFPVPFQGQGPFWPNMNVEMPWPEPEVAGPESGLFNYPEVNYPQDGMGSMSMCRSGRVRPPSSLNFSSAYGNAFPSGGPGPGTNPNMNMTFGPRQQPRGFRYSRAQKFRRAQFSRMGIPLEENNHCQLCRSNRETEQVYMGHTLRDQNGKVSCPILRALVCTICSATGDNAHTLKYCPLNQNVPLRLRSHNFDKARAAAVAASALVAAAATAENMEEGATADATTTTADNQNPKEENEGGVDVNATAAANVATAATAAGGQVAGEKPWRKYLPYRKVRNAIGHYHSLKY